MMKPLTCGVHSTDFMIQLCAIRLYRSVVSAKSHIGATLINYSCLKQSEKSNI